MSSSYMWVFFFLSENVTEKLTMEIYAFYIGV